MAHTENSVVVYVDDEEKESIRQEAKRCRKPMSRYLLDLHLNQTISKKTDAVKILHDRYIGNNPERLKSLQTERENNLKESIMFHTKNELYFERLSDGSVRIVKQDVSGGKLKLIMAEILDINTWASAVASVCIRGENSETFHQAIKLHDVDVPKQPI